MRDVIEKFLRYAVTGGSAAIVDAGGFALLVQTGMALAPAAVTSFCVAAVVNFWLTSKFVFGERATGRRFPLFAMMAIVGVTINVGVTMGVIAVFGAPPVLAKIVGIGIAFSINFLLNLTVVFRVRADLV